MRRWRRFWRPGQAPRTYVSRHLQVILILNVYTLIFTRARCTHTSRNDGTVLFACIVEHINMPLLNDSDPIQKGSQRRYMFPTQFENGKSSRDKWHVASTYSTPRCRVTWHVPLWHYLHRSAQSRINNNLSFFFSHFWVPATAHTCPEMLKAADMMEKVHSNLIHRAGGLWCTQHRHNIPHDFFPMWHGISSKAPTKHQNQPTTRLLRGGRQDPVPKMLCIDPVLKALWCLARV